ncbi:hypothetical protein CCACVL1_26768 [Corchorus capsularis]|uniref:Uncharacterized protein n=1 Tax=Corchorus capsularis TaxID=210143 RepID=A0A1R3GDC8_COCAP|nr:hypothetical protein CCACVL1_26768 [Corchorus capsularis]
MAPRKISAAAAHVACCCFFFVECRTISDTKLMGGIM